MALHRLSNETEILARIANGDEKAFAALFHAYHNQLGEFVQLLTHDRESTAEIVQEVFAKVWVNRESLPLVNKFDGYLFIRSEEHTSELQSLMRISYAVFCLKKKKNKQNTKHK